MLKLHIHLSEVIDDLKNAKCKPPSAQARNAYDTGAFQLNQSWYLTPTKTTISTLPALHLTSWMLGWHLGLARHRVLQDTASTEVKQILSSQSLVKPEGSRPVMRVEFKFKMQDVESLCRFESQVASWERSNSCWPTAKGMRPTNMAFKPANMEITTPKTQT